MSFFLVVIILSLPIVYYLIKTPSIPSIPNATPHLPILGNALAFIKDPVQYLIDQRALHGDVFLLNLGFVKFVYFLGPEGSNAIFRGTERSGLSQFDTLTLLLGLHANGYLDIIPAAHKSLSTPERLEYWMKLMRPIAKQQFEAWAISAEPVSLFRGISELVVTVLLYLFVGPEFADKHAKELVPLTLAYEAAIQKPSVRVFPRWLSSTGRFLRSTEKRFEKLIGEETKKRLESLDKYKDEMDLLQVLINILGGKNGQAYPYHILLTLVGGHPNQTTGFSWGLLHAIRSGKISELRKTKSRDLIEAIFREIGRLYTNFLIPRHVTRPQVVSGRQIPAGTYIVASPLVTARDPRLFSEPDKFRPERWLCPSGELDTAALKAAHRTATSIQFGKGQHACAGEPLGRLMVLDLWWDIILGNDEDPGYDVEIVSGIRDGVGIDNVGVEAAWIEENLGTPFEKTPVMVSFMKREKISS